MKHDLTTPAELGKYSDLNSNLRAHSPSRSKDGSFWCNSMSGTLYKFWPDDLRTETVSLLWTDHTYVPRFTASADGNFIYYIPNLLQSHSYYQPVMQFDTRSRKRKFIAFIADYYFDKYGFYNGGAHGIAVSSDGGTLVINFNGAFKPRVEPFYGNPALMVVRIPESERE
ncbi:MAG: hypothetical protein C5S52_00090 [ANME-2 cluster archaeon]|nr:hypothetical protein [ANME-2 cluster archaeon]